MRYELINKELQDEAVISENEYKIIIRLEIKDTESIADNFFRYIDVASSNDLTGFEVDEQREKEVENFLLSLNK